MKTIEQLADAIRSRSINPGEDSPDSLVYDTAMQHLEKDSNVVYKCVFILRSRPYCDQYLRRIARAVLDAHGFSKWMGL